MKRNRVNKVLIFALLQVSILLVSATHASTVATPVLNPSGKTFTGSLSVAISCATSGATIRYTTNGSVPTSSSPACSGSITLSATTTLQAKAFKSGMTDSAVASATYTKLLVCNYDANVGRNYAQQFAEANPSARFFYTAGKDCTNFVSQCVWAAYGGYVSGNDTQSKSNIASKVRMVPNVWHGGTGGGMPNWETVSTFWNYVTSGNALGPKATGYNDNAKYTSMDPLSVRVGDVLQVRNGGSGNYTHSVYVTTTLYGPPAKGQTWWDLIIVAQHSPDSKVRTASNLIQENGASNCYLRRLSFSTATFEK